MLTAFKSVYNSDVNGDNIDTFIDVVNNNFRGTMINLGNFVDDYDGFTDSSYYSFTISYGVQGLIYTNVYTSYRNSDNGNTTTACIDIQNQQVKEIYNSIGARRFTYENDILDVGIKLKLKDGEPVVLYYKDNYFNHIPEDRVNEIQLILFKIY